MFYPPELRKKGRAKHWVWTVELVDPQLDIYLLKMHDLRTDRKYSVGFYGITLCEFGWGFLDYLVWCVTERALV